MSGQPPFSLGGSSVERFLYRHSTVQKPVVRFLARAEIPETVFEYDGVPAIRNVNCASLVTRLLTFFNPLHVAGDVVSVYIYPLQRKTVRRPHVMQKICKVSHTGMHRYAPSAVIGVVFVCFVFAPAYHIVPRSVLWGRLSRAYVTGMSVGLRSQSSHLSGVASTTGSGSEPQNTGLYAFSHTAVAIADEVRIFSTYSLVRNDGETPETAPYQVLGSYVDSRYALSSHSDLQSRMVRDSDRLWRGGAVPHSIRLTEIKQQASAV